MSSAPSLSLGICRLYEEFKRRRAPLAAADGAAAVDPNFCDWDALPGDLPSIVAAAASEERMSERVDEAAVSQQPQQTQPHHSQHHKRRKRSHLSGHVKSLSVSGSNSTGGGHQKSPRQTRSLATLDPKDVKRALRRAAVSGLFDLLSRHERRAHARDRWLMRRLKRTLGSFELALASILARRAAAEGSTPAATAESQETSVVKPRDDRGHVGRQQLKQQQQATANSAETATACVQVADSETAGGGGLVASTKRGVPTTAGRQAMAAQSNCNNSTCCEIDSTDEDNYQLVIGCKYWRPGVVAGGATRQHRPPVILSSPSSTRSSCSVDSVTESGGQESAAYSGYNISSQTPRSPPLPQSPQPGSPFPRFPRDANCNHGTAASMRRQRPQQQQQQQQQQEANTASQTSQLIYADTGAGPEPYQTWPHPLQLQPPPPQQTPPKRVDIYSSAAARSQAVGATGKSQLHEAKASGVRCHQCQPVACGVHNDGDEGDGEEAAMVGASMRRPPPPQQQTRRKRRQKKKKLRQEEQPPQPQPQPPQEEQPQKPRCKRCDTKPRPCPGRARRQQLAAKRADKAAKRQARCQPGERSCGDCRPPRISLCPADGGGNGRGAENFTRIRLQTQPGRFITRQVLFFDGSYLYQPVQPKGPCY